MKTKADYIFLFALLIFPISAIFPQSVQDVYNLNFDERMKKNVRWSWLVNSQCVNFTIDSTKTVDGKFPLRISAELSPYSRVAKFMLMRTIPFPTMGNNAKGNVTIRSKNKNLKELKFSATYIDEDEDILFSDTVFITNPSWENYSISYTSKETRAVIINISAQEKNLQEEQCAWIDKISINVGDNIINNNEIEVLLGDTSFDLDSEYIVPLSISNNLLIRKIEGLDSKIIGLGECTHGSQEIKEARFQFMKTLITQFDHRVILLEKAIDFALKWDLYVRGLVSRAFEDQIKEECRAYFGDYISLFEFLSWVREYNKTAENKIRIFGYDRFADKQTCLFDYFKLRLSEETPNFRYYLQKLDEGSFQEVRKVAMNDIYLKEKLGDADLEYLLFLLDRNISIDSNINTNVGSREENMWSIIKKVIDIYAPNNSKVTVCAHSDHINKYVPILRTSLENKSLGNYIAQAFKDRYFAVSFQIAAGYYTQDEEGMFGETITHELQRTPKNSFEYKGLNTELDYFYYPSNQLSKDITHLRMLLRTGRYLDQFYFCSIKKRFDGLVFIKNSNKLNNIEKYPFFYTSGLIQKGQRNRKNTLNNLLNN